MRSQGFAFRVQHRAGCVSLPEANCRKVIFTSRNPDMKMVAGRVGRLGIQAPYVGDYLKGEGLVAALGI